MPTDVRTRSRPFQGHRLEHTLDMSGPSTGLCLSSSALSYTSKRRPENWPLRLTCPADVTDGPGSPSARSTESAATARTNTRSRNKPSDNFREDTTYHRAITASRQKVHQIGEEATTPASPLTTIAVITPLRDKERRLVRFHVSAASSRKATGRCRAILRICTQPHPCYKRRRCQCISNRASEKQGRARSYR
jgi:hypothetical protein